MAEPPKYLRDAKAVAAAWGLRLYDASRRKLLADQMEAVKLLLADTGVGLPAKVKTGGGLFWPRAEMVEWGQTRLKLAKDRRTFELLPAPLPPQPDPAAEDDLFTSLSPEEIKRANKERLQRNLKVHLGLAPAMQPLRQFEVQELVKNGLIPPVEDLSGPAAAGGGAGDEIYGGLEGIAAAINKEFAGANCHAQYVSDWLKGKRYPCTKSGVPPMPAPHQSGRHKRSLVFPWYRQYVLTEMSAPEFPLKGGLDARSRKELADAELAEMAAEAERKRTSGLYTLTEIHERTLAAAGMEMRNTVRDALERNLPKVFASGLRTLGDGLTPELETRLLEKLRADCVTVFNAWQTQAVAALDAMAQTQTET